MTEPSTTATQVRRKAGQNPNITDPTRAVMLLGMGATITEMS